MVSNLDSKFPSKALGDIEELAKKIPKSHINRDFSNNELAAWAELDKHAIRALTGAAKQFKVFESDRPGNFWLTELGKRFTDKHTLEGAKVDAVLNIPLFKHLLAKYGSEAFPSHDELDSELCNYGVESKSQRGKAVSVFRRSAQLAGYWEDIHRMDRMILKNPQSNHVVSSEEVRQFLSDFIDIIPASIQGGRSMQTRNKLLKVINECFDLIWGEVNDIESVTKSKEIESADELRPVN